MVSRLTIATGNCSRRHADTKLKRLQSLSRLTAPAPFAQRSLLIRFICASVRYIFRFVGRGLAPAAVLFGQSGTPVPTFRKRAFVSSHTKKRCVVWDTVASVPTTFLLLFSSPEKRRYLTQSGTSVLTVRIISFRHIQMTFKKASFALQGRWLRAIAKKTVGSFGGRTQFIPTVHSFPRTNP